MTNYRRQKFKPESAQKLMRVAKDDLYAAEFLMSAPQCRPETVLYHVQQAAEKSLKAVAIFLGVPVVLTHDLDVLKSELPQSVCKELPVGAGELTQYATIRRYLDGEELIETKDLLEAIKVGKIFIEWALKNLNS